MTYVLSNQADDDILQIYLRGTDLFGSQQAEIYHARLANTFDLLARNPGMGPVRPELKQDIHAHPCGPHIILYRIDPDQTVTIIRIGHASEDWAIPQ